MQQNTILNHKIILTIYILCLPTLSNTMFAKTLRKLQGYFVSRQLTQLEEMIKIEGEQEAKEQAERLVKPKLMVELDKAEDDGLKETIVFSAMGHTAYGDRAIEVVYTAIMENEHEKRECVEILQYVIGMKKYGNLLIDHSTRGKKAEQDEPHFHEDRVVARKIEEALVKYKKEIDLLWAQKNR